MDSPATAHAGDQTLDQRIDRLHQAEQYERLRHDAAFFSDIWKDDEKRFDNFAELFGADGKWDDGDGKGAIEGRDRIAAKLRTLPEVFALKLGLHLLGSPRMDASADGGSARWPMLCFVTSDGGISGFVAGQYLETYCVRNERSQIDHSAVEAAVMPGHSGD